MSQPLGINLMKTLTKLLLFLIFLLSAGSVNAKPVSVDVRITADNHYALYYGNAIDGLTLVGMNEIGRNGNPGLYNWSEAEFWSFDMDDDDGIYIAGWSDGKVAQALIGEFHINGEKLYTNTQDWLYKSGNKNLDDGDLAPTADEIKALIGGTWGAVNNALDHGVYPWGQIAGIAPDANWIWGTPDMNNTGSDAAELQLFRTKALPTPEPDTFTLFSLAFLTLLGLMGIRMAK
jgi:hypothetical protein